MYSKGTIINTEVNDNGPQFGKIKQIYIADNNIYLVISNLNVLYFEKHYHAFKVLDNDAADVVRHINELPNNDYSAIMTKILSDFYVATRYDL